MIYPPTQAPSPQARPPRVNREIVAVLMAMACISAFLIHYTRDSWCDQPVLGSFCLPALFEAESAADGAEGSADDERTGSGLSRPGSLEGVPLAQPPTPEPLDTFTGGVDPWTMEGAIPPPSSEGSSVIIDPAAYPGPRGDRAGSAGLAPTPFNLDAFVSPAATTAAGLSSATPDYRATSTAQAALSGGSATPAGDATTAADGTATATATSGPTSYPPP